jgi:hypothetical protein
MTNSYPAYLLLALAVASLVGARSAHAQERYIYWIGATDAEENRGNTIFRYSLDRAVLDTLVQAHILTSDPFTPHYFYYVTVDSLGEKIYWTDSGGIAPDGSIYIGAIRRASLDGDSVEVYLGGIVCGLGSPKDIELDTVGEMLYWGVATDCVNEGLYRADLGSSRPSQWLRLTVNRAYVVDAIELDLRHQMIYWVSIDYFVEPPPGILRAPLNDTVSDEYIVPGSICDIALAHTLSKIYWAPCNNSTIRRANLDGTEVEDMIVSQGEIGKLAIDHKGGKIYWTETSEGTIMRANLDGSEGEEILSGLVVPTSLALNFGWDLSVAVEPEEEIPDRAALQSIYPNPVQERATIAFALTEPAHVMLEIYDQLGRRVEVLASGMYPPGTFQVQWNPTSQANGVYFCRMASDNRSETIVLVLQR